MKILKNGKPVKSSCFRTKGFEKKIEGGLGKPSDPQKKRSKFQSKKSPCNLRRILQLRSGSIYCILAANRLIGRKRLLFTQNFLPHVNKSLSLPRTHTISALSTQEFQLLDISPLPQHLSLVNTAIK